MASFSAMIVLFVILNTAGTFIKDIQFIDVALNGNQYFILSVPHWTACFCCCVYRRKGNFTKKNKALLLFHITHEHCCSSNFQKKQYKCAGGIGRIQLDSNTECLWQQRSWVMHALYRRPQERKRENWAEKELES